MIPNQENRTCSNELRAFLLAFARRMVTIVAGKIQPCSNVDEGTALSRIYEDVKSRLRLEIDIQTTRRSTDDDFQQGNATSDHI